MKKHVLTTIFALAATTGFAVDAIPAVQSLTPAVQLAPDKQVNFSEKLSGARGFFYVKMNVAEPEAHAPQLKQTSFLPGLGIGYRRGNASAIDISFSGSYIQDQGQEAVCWSLPKMSYLRYFSPKKSSSFYGGLGLTWGGVSLKNKHETVTVHSEELGDGQTIYYSESSHSRTTFFGLIPTACVGYESNRQEASWRSFVQLEVSQPMLAVSKKGQFPGPVAEFSVGLGY